MNKPLLQKLAAHLKRYGSITQKTAIEKFGTWVITQRIADLRKSGWKIDTKLITVKNRFGEKSKVAKWILKKAA